ncbi:MAG: hypothetical protein ACSHXD_13090 [Marinosulfonomonas sp.]
MKHRLLAVIALPLLASSAWAEGDIAQVNTCLSQAAQGQGDPAACIEDLHAPCLDNAQETPAVATLCLKDTRKIWSDGIASVIADTVAEFDEKQAAVVRIEVKYDLLTNLLQCDRLEELSLATTEISGADSALQAARCQSTASALTYARLYTRTQSNSAE